MAVLLSRYEGADSSEVLALSLTGAGIALFGLLVVAVAAGIRRGSALSRLLATIYLGLVVVFAIVVTVSSERWDAGAIVLGVIAVVIVVLLWTPPASRTFGPLGAVGYRSDKRGNRR